MESSIIQSCPFPTSSSDKNRRDGFFYDQPSMCKKCSLDCWDYFDSDATEELIHAECPKGFSMVRASISSNKVLINGILVNELNKTCPPTVRKRNRSQKVAWQRIEQWVEDCRRMVQCLEEETSRKAAQAILSLHDIKAAVSLVLRNAESIIATLDGDNDEERIENANPNLKSLLKSIQLLHRHLKASSIVVNPDAASHGQKRITPVYKIFDLMARIYDSLAAERSVRIIMKGNSYKKPRCFDSFDLIPMVLIDNAVKYSLMNQAVSVVIEDRERPSSVYVSVESYGPIVPFGYREEVFKKGVRTPGAKGFASSGAGLGLYIAQTVAKANGFKIFYEAPKEKVGIDGEDVGINKFWFMVPN